MKNFLLASSLLVAAAGSAYAATHGDDGGTATAKAAGCAAVERCEDCPASALVAKWEKAAEHLAAMPARTRETVARARTTLSASCPVCREAPTSFALLGRFLDSTVALDGRLLAACEEVSKSQSCDEAPEEIRSAFAQRVAIGAKARALYAAFASAMAPVEPTQLPNAHGATTVVGKVSDPAAASVAIAGSGSPELTPAEAGKEFESISAEASRLATRWNGVPARAAALPAETKSQLLEAMEVLKREVPTCDLANESMSVLAEGLERLVALDTTLAKHCKAASRDRSEELPAEIAEMKRAIEVRTKATANVAELLRVMKKTMTPDIFQARPATVVVGARQ